MSKSRFGWNDELSTGHDVIDKQHKELIALILKFLEESSDKTVTETIDFLSDYVFDHFSYEEKLMLQTFYPGFKEHRDEHSHYVKYIYDLREKLKMQQVILEEMERELANWLLDHILSDDQKMARHIKKYGHAAN